MNLDAARAPVPLTSGAQGLLALMTRERWLEVARTVTAPRRPLWWPKSLLARHGVAKAMAKRPIATATSTSAKPIWT